MSFVEVVNESANHLSKTPFCYPENGRDVKFGQFSDVFQRVHAIDTGIFGPNF